MHLRSRFATYAHHPRNFVPQLRKTEGKLHARYRIILSPKIGRIEIAPILKDIAIHLIAWNYVIAL